MLTRVLISIGRFHPIHALVFVSCLTALEVKLERTPRASADGIWPINTFELFFFADSAKY